MPARQLNAPRCGPAAALIVHGADTLMRPAIGKALWGQRKSLADGNRRPLSPVLWLSTMEWDVSPARAAIQEDVTLLAYAAEQGVASTCLLRMWSTAHGWSRYYRRCTPRGKQLVHQQIHGRKVHSACNHSAGVKDFMIPKPPAPSDCRINSGFKL